MITITNKNIYRSDQSISDLSSLDNVDIVDSCDITNYLADDVELGESVTFKRLFDIVSPNVDKFNEIFYSALGGFPLGPFLQEIENNPTEKFESDYLEIHWHCDTYENEFNIDSSLHGISLSTSDSYAMDFASLNNLKNYNVKLNKKVETFNYKNFKESNEENVDINSLRTYLGEKSFTLFELYTAIFYEISFFGGPQDKKEKLHELEESMEEVENMMEVKDEDELKKLTSFEDMLEEFDAKDKYLVKYEKLRDRVEKDRISNKKNLVKLKNCLKEKLKVYDLIEKSDDNLQQYYKKLTDIEYNMQLLYGESEDISYHRFWETPKCTCPKIDNLEIYPSKTPIFNNNCLIHKE